MAGTKPLRTRSPADRAADLLDRTLSSFFLHHAPLTAGDTLVVAFSGGPDSTALLWGLSRLAGTLGVGLVAAHLDHGLDADSPRRARAAQALAAGMGVAAEVARLEVAGERRRGESVEAAARRVRYGWLEAVRERRAARYVATAHHLDDQAETVLLRWLGGSGITGLGGIRPQWGPIVRPLLGLRRSQLAGALAAGDLRPVADPGNLDPAIARNRLRHHLLPRLCAADPELPARLARLSAAARGAAGKVEATLAARLRPQVSDEGVRVLARPFAELPPVLAEHALALLHRRADAPYPAPGAARRELLRQLAAGGRLGCDCGGGWRWEGRREHLLLCRPAPPPPPFSYTFTVPGEVVVPEIGIRLRLTRGPVAPWMYRGGSRRVGLSLPVRAGQPVEVRSRHPGDRVQPFGRSRPRRLKEILIDHRIPRRRREAIPLLCAGALIAWVPGVTIDERCRLRGERRAWIAELEDA